jgi:hypothetical protein
MSIIHDEKRDFIRMTTDAPLSFTTKGSPTVYEGQCLNLSAVGVLFTSEENVPCGTLMEINITPAHAVVPPLIATVEVVRSQTYDDGRYAIAAQIKVIH